MFLHYGDMTDSSNLNRILEKVQPNEIYLVEESFLENLQFGILNLQFQ